MEIERTMCFNYLFMSFLSYETFISKQCLEMAIFNCLFTYNDENSDTTCHLRRTVNSKMFQIKEIFILLLMGKMYYPCANFS